MFPVTPINGGLHELTNMVMNVEHGQAGNVIVGHHRVHGARRRRALTVLSQFALVTPNVRTNFKQVCVFRKIALVCSHKKRSSGRLGPFGSRSSTRLVRFSL